MSNIWADIVLVGRVGDPPLSEALQAPAPPTGPVDKLAERQSPWAPKQQPRHTSFLQPPRGFAGERKLSAQSYGGEWTRCGDGSFDRPLVGAARVPERGRANSSECMPSCAQSGSEAGKEEVGPDSGGGERGRAERLLASAPSPPLLGSRSLGHAALPRTLWALAHPPEPPAPHHFQNPVEWVQSMGPMLMEPGPTFAKFGPDAAEPGPN